jgi:hypothetical protein
MNFVPPQAFDTSMDDIISKSAGGRSAQYVVALLIDAIPRIIKVTSDAAKADKAISSNDISILLESMCKPPTQYDACRDLTLFEPRNKFNKLISRYIYEVVRPVKIRRPTDTSNESELIITEQPVAPERYFKIVNVDDGFYMVHKLSHKAYRADLNEHGDKRALLDQQVGVFMDGNIMPIFDDEEEAGVFASNITMTARPRDINICVQAPSSPAVAVNISYPTDNRHKIIEATEERLKKEQHRGLLTLKSANKFHAYKNKPIKLSSNELEDKRNAEISRSWAYDS